MTELAILKEKTGDALLENEETYAQSRAHDSCFKRCVHAIALHKNVEKLELVRNMGAEMLITKETKDGPVVDWSDYRSLQSYHQKVVDAKIEAAAARAAAIESKEKESKTLAENSSSNGTPSISRPPSSGTTLTSVKSVVATFMGGASGSSLTDEQAQLICAMFLHSGCYEKIQAICSTSLNWNFTAYVPGRTDAVTPLSLLCRPELCNALSEIRAHPKEIADGLQLNLIEYAISNGTKNKEVWKNKIASVDPMFANRRAISDTVYQGRVDILRLLVEYFPEIKNVLRTQLEFGSSYLHMAAHDGRTEMAIYLIDDIEVPIEVESTRDAPKSCRGQTPLFWCFARGVVNAKCASALVERGADPCRLWHATKDGKRIATLSPLSMALVTAPEFAEKVLTNLRPRVGNRGLKQVFRPTFINSFVSEDGKQLEFAPQIEPEKGTVWETFNYDKRPRTHRSLLQLMIEQRSKKMLCLPISKFVLHVMWFEFGFEKFSLDFLRFTLYAVCVGTTVGLYDAGLKISDVTGESFVDASDRNLAWVPPFVISFVITISLVLQEVAEMRKLKEKYLLEIKNYWDIAAILMFWVMGTAMVVVYASPDLSVESVVAADYLIKICNGLLHLTFISGFLEFAAVPKVSGPFVSMIWCMLGDVGSFLVMFMVFYVCFIAAMWPMARDGGNGTPGETLQLLLETLFFWLVAQPDPSVLDDWGRNREIARLVFFVYAVVCWILLLNMLIAMMNNTYNLVQEDAEGEWCMNWGRFMCYSYDSASENDQLCVTTFLKECSGKTQEQTLAQMSADLEEKSWVDDVRDGVAVLRTDISSLSEFIMKRASGVSRVSTRSRLHSNRLRSALVRVGSSDLKVPEEEEAENNNVLRLSESE